MFSKWAAIARHPEPEYQLLISYRANRSQNRKEFSSFQKRLRLGHPQLAGIWTHPEKWRELQALIEKTGFVALPTFVELGESFRHYLKDRKVLAFCPTWDRGRVLEGLSGVLSERKIREH